MGNISLFFERFLHNIAPKIIIPPKMEKIEGFSPIPINTQIGLKIASNVAIIIDSVADTYLIPSLNII